MESEAQYHRLIENDGVAELVPTFGCFYTHRGDAVEDEAYFHHIMQTFYEKEQEVYDSLKHIQGRCIPASWLPEISCHLNSRFAINRKVYSFPGNYLTVYDSGLLDFLHTPPLNTLRMMAGVGTIGLMIFNKRMIENAKKTGKASEPFTKEFNELVAGLQSTLGFKQHIPTKDDGDSLVDTVIHGGQGSWNINTKSCSGSAGANSSANKH